MRRGFSLRWQLLSAMVLVFALGLAWSLVSYELEVRKLGSDLAARTLEEQARELMAGIGAGSGDTVELKVPPAWEQAYADPGGAFAFTLYDRAGRPIARSRNLAAPLPFQAVPEGATFSGVDVIAGGPKGRVAMAARAPKGDILVVARTGIGAKTLVDSLFEEASEQLLVLVPFAIAALGLIWLITWWSLRPVTRASREAAAIGPANPAERISARGLPREMRPLVAAVNGALDRLAAAYARERRITADAAHALRTPLAVLSLRLQRARTNGVLDWPQIERELAAMSRLVGQLLDLARKEASQQREDGAAMAPLNLARIVREAAAIILPLLEREGRQLILDAPEAAAVRGDADDLRDLVGNLLENALSHGRGSVTVTLRRDSEAQQAGYLLEVADEGGGVPAGMEDEVFQRFRKLDANSPGAGLGLAIVRQVALSHRGSVRFLPGEGRVVVSLPAA